MATSLAKDVTVIPILLRGVEMPAAHQLPEDLKSLSKRNAIKLNDENWRADLGLLTAVINRTMGISGSLASQRIKRIRQVVFTLSLLGAILSLANSSIIDRNAFLVIAVKIAYLIILSANTIFVTYLLVNIKQNLDRLGWLTVATMVVATLFVEWGPPLSLFTPIPLLIVAWLINFIKSEE